MSYQLMPKWYILDKTTLFYQLQKNWSISTCNMNGILEVVIVESWMNWAYCDIWLKKMKERKTVQVLNNQKIKKEI